MQVMSKWADGHCVVLISSYGGNEERILLCFVLDLKLHLQSTDYGNFLANEASPLAVATIDDKLKEKLVVEFQHMRNHALPPLSTFLDYIT